MRFEYKYVVPMSLLDGLRRDIYPFVRLDKFAARREERQYTVRSIYYDTARMTAYREKVEGFAVRRKLRVRGYDEVRPDSTAFLEIKAKLNDRILKHRTPVPFDRLAGGGLEAACAVTGNGSCQFMYYILRDTMRPVLLVTYDREAYVGKFERNLRITLDKNLRCAPFPALTELDREQDVRRIKSGYFIMEIKFDNSFSPWLQAVITNNRLTRTSASKYVTCVDGCADTRFLAGAGRLLSSGTGIPARMGRIG